MNTNKSDLGRWVSGEVSVRAWEDGGRILRFRRGVARDAAYIQEKGQSRRLDVGVK